MRFKLTDEYLGRKPMKRHILHDLFRNILMVVIVLLVDRKNVYTVALSQSFLKYCFASFAFNYTDNKSNADLFSFDKETYTAMLGFYF